MNPRLSLQYLTNRLKSLRNFILVRDVASGLALIISAVGVLLVIGFIFNSAFFLSTTFRTIFVAITGLIVAAIFICTIALKLMKLPSTEAVALDVEKTYPELQNRLIASLQLERNLQQNREGFSTEMIQAVINQSEQMCRNFDFNKSVDKQPLKRGLKYFGSTGLVLLVLAVLFPGSLKESIYLFSHPTQEIARNLGYTLDVNPKNSEVAKFAPIKIQATLKGKNFPSEATLYWRYEDGPVKAEALAKDASVKSNLGAKLALNDSSLMSYEIREVKKSFEYWVVAGEIQSPVFNVTAVDKPRILGLKLTYEYPAYTGLQPLVVDENDGNISALKGTKVKIEASVNKPVTTASVVLASGTSQPLEISKQTLHGTIEVKENGTYHLAVVDNLGNNNPDPIEYKIESIADLAPEVDLFQPGAPVELGDDMALTLGFKLFDDFGFSSMNLVYRIFTAPGETFEKKVPLVFDKKAGHNFEMQYPWDVSNIGLEPGGWVEYYIEVFDNDAITGPKRGVSQKLTARLKSLQEQFAYLDQESQDQIADLEQLKQKQEDLLEKTQELREELQSNKKLDWEKKQEIQKSIASQQNVLDDMQKTAEKMQQMQDEMKKNDMTSLEIMQKLQELQKLFQQVATPEMKEAMKKLQEQMEKMTPEEMKKAAEQMQLSQQELKEKIERTIAQLKVMQIQQKMENIMRQLSELVKQQESVNKQTESSDTKDLPSLEPSENKNSEDFQKLQKQAQELEKMMTEQKLDQLEQAQKFLDGPRQSKAGEHMKAMSGSLSQKKKSESKQQGEMALDDLKKMEQQMEESKNNFNSALGQQSAEKMKDAANDLLYVSDQQEGVYDKAEQTDQMSPQLQQLASEQQALQRTMSSLDAKMKDISKQSAFFNPQITKMMAQAQNLMDQSTQNLIDRNAPAAMRAQKDAMFSLNQAANQLMQSMQSQSNCSNGSCNNENLFKKMNKLSNSQKKINQQSNGMCNNPSPGSADKQGMARLAQEQAGVQKSLSDLSREQGSRKEILGRLDEMGKEMKKVVEDLESGNLNQSTLKRQEQIHSRMLDFQRSLERQDFSEERKAETTDEIVRQSPPALKFDAQSNKNSYQDRLQKYLNEGFPPEYEELIKEYFRAVNGSQPK